MSKRTRQLVVVANTLPVRRGECSPGDGWKPSPGGLASALRPVVRESSGAWVGWAGTSAEAPRAFTHDGIHHLPITLSANELSNYYEGLCNQTLWPLYHDAVRQPLYHRHWWADYVTVNRRFARAAAGIVAQSGIVWVQDYQLQLVPRMLRELRDDIRIGFFLHIPFPPPELFRRLPWRREVIEGLLGADVIGFQTRSGASNFATAATRLGGARRKGIVLESEGRRTVCQAFPISIDQARYEHAARDPGILDRAATLRQRLGDGRRLILGVDRLDYTKGIALRLKAFDELLRRRDRGIRDAVLVQVAVPSREHIVEYQELRSEVEELVGQINGRLGEVGTIPIHYLRRNLPFEELVAMYRAADVMLVTPLCDGMNLVAKEYVATRWDGTGVLVLSEFAGAAAELRSALLVNPHDVNGMAETMDRALGMPAAETRRRMRRLHQVVERHTVHDWAREFLDAVRT